MMALRRYNVDAVIVVSATQLSGPDLNWATEGRRAVLVNRMPAMRHSPAYAATTQLVHARSPIIFTASATAALLLLQDFRTRPQILIGSTVSSLASPNSASG
jgi:hypothetical protein